MGEAALLITAVSGLVTAIAGAIALLVTTLRSSKKERENAANEAMNEVLLHITKGDPLLREILKRRMEEDGEEDDDPA